MNVKNLASLLTWPARCLPIRWGASVWSLLALASVALLVLCSCAHTEKGLQREERLYEFSTNAVTVVSRISPALPAPISPIAEGAVAVAAGLLALWSSHLHRSIQELKDGKSNGSPPPGSPPPPAPGV
jgi:hypothetical protein